MTPIQEKNLNFLVQVGEKALFSEPSGVSSTNSELARTVIESLLHPSAIWALRSVVSYKDDSEEWGLIEGDPEGHWSYQWETVNHIYYTVRQGTLDSPLIFRLSKREPKFWEKMLKAPA